MTFRQRFADSFHKYLRIPYALNVHEFQSPKKPKATFVLIHGIGGTFHTWDQVVAKMPEDVRIIGIDLLGFGKSPKPGWATYNAKTQARSLGVTLLKMATLQRPIIVGHSLGSLVAIETAKRYPFIPSRLVLCSPPFYKPEATGEFAKSADDMLRMLYRTAKKYPKQLEQLSALAVKLGLANSALNITSDNITSYMAALESSIINQTSMQDVAKLRLPIDIFYGRFDPVVIKKHIVAIEKNQSNVAARKLNTAHEITGGYVDVVAKHLTELANG